MIETQCLQCGNELRRAGRGRPQRYCSTRCRVAGHRARRTAIPPAELTERDRWVRRGEDKAPLQANGRPASVTDPATWSTFRQAAASRHGVGLGYVLAAGDQIVCIDLDHCLDRGRLAPWAREILAASPATFVEVSPSGTGLHIWGRGGVSRGRCIRRGDGAAIEIYGAGRYIALGERYGDVPAKLADLTDLIGQLT